MKCCAASFPLPPSPGEVLCVISTALQPRQWESHISVASELWRPYPSPCLCLVGFRLISSRSPPGSGWPVSRPCMPRWAPRGDPRRGLSSSCAPPAGACPYGSASRLRQFPHLILTAFFARDTNVPTRKPDVPLSKSQGHTGPRLCTGVSATELAPPFCRRHETTPTDKQ